MGIASGTAHTRPQQPRGGPRMVGTTSIRNHAFLCDLCVDAFLIGVLHTEIAKIAKTGSVWVTLGSVVIRSFAFFAISVWIVFSDRSLTHRDRKDR
jgi:hypothetical protein